MCGEHGGDESVAPGRGGRRLQGREGLRRRASRYGNGLRGRGRRGLVRRAGDAGEVERVGGGDGDQVGRLVVARGAERVDGFGQGELLAAEASDEAAATDLAAGLEAAEDAEEVAPFGAFDSRVSRSRKRMP